MIRKQKRKLVWGRWNSEHIKKHNVTIDEVEEVYNKQELTGNAKKGRKLIISKTLSGRIITVILSYEKQSAPYVVSARDASVKERNFYYEKIVQAKTNSTI